MVNSLKVFAKRSVLALSCLAGAASAANADVYWLVTGTFDDGTKLDAKLDVNVYGYLADWKAVTKQNGPFSAEIYVPPFNSSIGPNPPPPTLQTILFADSYFTSTLQLTFADDLGLTSSSPNLIVGGEGGPSFECQASWACGFVPPIGNPVRYLTDGVAISVSESVYASAVPEPGVWIMMLLGFGGIGFMMRGARRKDTVALA